MSEVIVRMEKVPKNCDDGCWGYLSGECPWSDHVDGYTMDGGRPRNCPIKGVLPEQHGRLGDLDSLAKMVNFARIEAMQKGSDTNPYWLLGDIIAQAKTIVPATERSER